MENSTLFPFSYLSRKTGEEVEIIAWETIDKGAKSENDWVSYIDSKGEAHIKEKGTLEWDFKINNPFNKCLDYTPKFPEFDVWDSRKWDLIKEMIISDNYKHFDVDFIIKIANQAVEKYKELENTK